MKSEPAGGKTFASPRLFRYVSYASCVTKTRIVGRSPSSGRCPRSWAFAVTAVAAPADPARSAARATASAKIASALLIVTAGYAGRDPLRSPREGVTYPRETRAAANRRGWIGKRSHRGGAFWGRTRHPHRRSRVCIAVLFAAFHSSKRLGEPQRPARGPERCRDPESDGDAEPRAFAGCDGQDEPAASR